MDKIYGKVLIGTGGNYDVLTYEGDNSVVYTKCKPRGIFKHETITLLAGDDVVMTKSSDTYTIDEIKKRKNALIRPPLANLDVMFIVIASANPAPIVNYCDKLVSICEYNKIQPVIIVSKGELDELLAKSIYEIYKKCGFDVFVCSSENGIGIDEIRGYIQGKCAGKTSAFAGASGVGKSTLVNRLYPKLDCETGEISKKIDRGKNTTRHTKLYETGYNTFLCDTAGFSMLDFVKFDFYNKDELPSLFREFEPYIGKCKYTKCTHTKEDGCRILEAVANGDIPKERHDSFLAIYNDLKDKKEWKKTKNRR